MHEAPLYTLEALPMFAALVLWNVSHPGRVLVGPNSEFPKREKKQKEEKKTKSKKGAEIREPEVQPDAHDLHLLRPSLHWARSEN